jgi:hypothetical protein
MVKMSREEFLTEIERENILSLLVAETATPEVIRSFEDTGAIDIRLTFNGIEVDVRPFLRQLEVQYFDQVKCAARMMYSKRVDDVLDPVEDVIDDVAEDLGVALKDLRLEAYRRIAKVIDDAWWLEQIEEGDVE